MGSFLSARNPADKAPRRKVRAVLFRDGLGILRGQRGFERKMERFYRVAPALFGLLALALWEAAVRLLAFLQDPKGLLLSLGSTLTVTFTALIASAVLGAAMALAMSASRLAQAAIQPWAVVLQVTPIVAIAPLIIVWVGDPFASLVVCAMIVAFFPVFANTATGLASAPADLVDLFGLYGAGRWRTLTLLRLPAALPYFLSGLRISGGLALVGAVVAEFVAGSGGFASGLAYRILEAGYRLEIPRMFASLVLLSLTGIAINSGLDLFGRLILRGRTAR